MYFKGIQEIEKQLDPLNMKILMAMWKFGPRNLLEVSRRTDLPFTTVYHRVHKLEAKSKRIVYLLPSTNKLGLVRVIAPVAARPGYEEQVTRALKIPNLWSAINRCEGSFTHYSSHSVPLLSVSDFKRYITHLSMSGLITNFKFIATTDLIPNFPDFRYYNSDEKHWSFKWKQWARDLRRITPSVIDDPEDYRLEADYRDLLIIKELWKNGRKTFAELAPILGISLQAVKYRYDRLVRIGAIKHFQFDVWRFPVEISAYHEVMLQFTSKEAMNAFFALTPELMFVYSVAKVIGENSLMVRTYLPESQVANMFGFFSELAKAGFLASYSSVRLNFAQRELQSISYELFQDGKGWSFNLDESLSELSRLVPQRIPVEMLERINRTADQGTFESALR